MPICNQGLCNCLTKPGRHSCYQNNHILQPLKNDCESRAQIYKNSMMISGTTIVWCGTQDSTIMDGRHTSGIFTVQTKFPPMLQLPVRAIIAICLRHIFDMLQLLYIYSSASSISAFSSFTPGTFFLQSSLDTPAYSSPIPLMIFIISARTSFGESTLTKVYEGRIEICGQAVRWNSGRVHW